MNGSGSKEDLHQKCAKCLNHGKVIPLKGHKKYCPWDSCNCLLCRTTEIKRKITAARAAQRRAKMAEAQRGASSNGVDTQQSEKVRQFCRLCKNHGKKTRLKGHKRQCPYRARLHLVICDDCSKAVDRRKIIASRTAQRRAEAIDRDRMTDDSKDALDVGTPSPSSQNAGTPVPSSTKESVREDVYPQMPSSTACLELQLWMGGFCRQVATGSFFLAENIAFINQTLKMCHPDVSNTLAQDLLKVLDLVQGIEEMRAAAERSLQDLTHMEQLLQLSRQANGYRESFSLH